MVTDRNRRMRGSNVRREKLEDAWQRWQATRVNSKSTLTHKTDASAFRALPATLRTSRISEVTASHFRVALRRAARNPDPFIRRALPQHLQRLLLVVPA